MRKQLLLLIGLMSLNLNATLPLSIIDVAASGYTLYHYTLFIKEFAQNPYSRPVQWSQFFKYGIYDYRSPQRMYPWIPTSLLALYLAALTIDNWTGWPGNGTLEKQDKSIKATIFKASMATAIAAFWLPYLKFGLAYLTQNPLVPASLWLAARALISCTQHHSVHKKLAALGSSLFLHRTKKARPSF